jgi:peptide/nickel transport system substrate-binding protein
MVNFYYHHSIVLPKKGGEIKIGLVGEPQSINPVITRANDSDRILIELLYNGLLKVDGKGGLKNDLADKIEISADGSSYLIFLKENIFWHDGVPLTADDVVFTIETIQDKNFQSPIRDIWQGVVVEELSSNAVRLTLKNNNQVFLQNLTLKILPKHIWENIDFKSFSRTDYNLKPIGTGPFVFENLEKSSNGQIISYTLVRNEKYFVRSPYLDKIKFIFYDNYTDLKNGLLKGEVKAMFPLYSEDYSFFQKKSGFNLKQLLLNRYFAVFWNLNTDIFKDKTVREALELAVDKKKLQTEILNNQAIILDGPFNNFSQSEGNNYSSERAKELINGREINFTLSLPEDYELIRVGQYLVSSWEQIGVKVDLQILPLSELEKEVILPRNYQSLLFGEILNQSLDLFSFWHSSQAGVNGLNLSSFSNKELDKLIEENWNAEEEKRQENFQKMQKIFEDEKPALFLYNPYYLYLLPQQLKGQAVQTANIPAEIFSDVENWYLFTERNWSFN